VSLSQPASASMFNTVVIAVGPFRLSSPSIILSRFSGMELYLTSVWINVIMNALLGGKPLNYNDVDLIGIRYK